LKIDSFKVSNFNFIEGRQTMAKKITKKAKGKTKKAKAAKRG